MVLVFLMGDELILTDRFGVTDASQQRFFEDGGMIHPDLLLAHSEFYDPHAPSSELSAYITARLPECFCYLSEYDLQFA
jgi:hypothetical protein